jgi:hypothetical protein
MFAVKEDDTDLVQLLIYLTGLKHLPSNNFQRKGSIYFEHDLDTWTAPFPFANTCAFRLRLPIVSSFTAFCTNFRAALAAGDTFTEH